MTIRISHEPVGALGRLAFEAGTATGALRRAERQEDFGFRRGILEQQLGFQREQKRIDRQFRLRTIGMQIQSQRVAEDAVARRQRAGDKALARRQQDLFELQNPDPDSPRGQRLTDIAEQRLRTTVNVKSELANEHMEKQGVKRRAQIEKARSTGVINDATAERMIQDLALQEADLKTPLMPEGTVQDQIEQQTVEIGPHLWQYDPQTGEHKIIGDSPTYLREQEEKEEALKRQKEENSAIDKLAATLIDQEEKRREAVEANRPPPAEGEDPPAPPEPIDQNQYWMEARRLIQEREGLIAEEEWEAGAEDRERQIDEIQADLAAKHERAAAVMPTPTGLPADVYQSPYDLNSPQIEGQAPAPPSPPSPETIDAAIDDLRLRLGRWPTPDEVTEYLGANSP